MLIAKTCGSWNLLCVTRHVLEDLLLDGVLIQLA